MKKILFSVLLIFTSFIVSGSGYKGTLPDLNLQKDKFIKEQETNIQNNNDILPLDKLTIPVRETKKVDKVLVSYQKDMLNVIGQLERMKEVLDGDKSFKNYIAAANVLDLTTQNILEKYKEERFFKTNKILSDINDDTQTIKNYWININKNAPYVLHYDTDDAYSGKVLNEQLNRFSKVLGYAIRELRAEFIKE